MLINENVGCVYFRQAWWAWQHSLLSHVTRSYVMAVLWRNLYRNAVSRSHVQNEGRSFLRVVTDVSDSAIEPHKWRHCEWFRNVISSCDGGQDRLALRVAFQCQTVSNSLLHFKSGSPIFAVRCYLAAFHICVECVLWGG